MASLPGRDRLDPGATTELQRLQAELLELVRRSRQTDELTALAFQDFLVEVAAREAARGR